MNPAVPVNDIDHFEIVALAGDLLTIACERAWPPGARVRLRLDSSSCDPVWLGGKIASVKGTDGARFTIGVRLHNLTSAHRIALKERA